MYFFTHLLIAMMIIFSSMEGMIGYFCVPVVDLVAKPFSVSKNKSIAALYEGISISPERGKDSCLRVHQGIFNEQVTILGYQNEQVHIELTNCFSQPMPGLQCPVQFWTRADWVISHEELDHIGIDHTIFPYPIRYDSCYQSSEEYITLIMPWYDLVTDSLYSAGTRFVIINDLPEGYAIVLYNYQTQHTASSIVPKSIALPGSFKTADEQKKAFVELLQIWCSLDDAIPFVWGGTSFSYVCCDDKALLEQEYKDGVVRAYWNRPAIKQRPYSGFDASGFIMRAAQIVGAPFFCLNSTTVSHNLRSLQHHEALEEGDILWTPGYVAVVGSIERNELIEAQGYARGYGKMHALKLHNKFANIYSWNDFLYSYERGLPLQSLNKDGYIVNTIPKYILYKFPSKNKFQR
jgi:hypothetical protein